MSESLIDKIADRQRKLLLAGKELKEHFVGIDEPIDRILHHVAAWYCAPEILSRPTTVCLWGLTGVGKTDLVRRFSKAIGMQDSFVEMQMTNQGSSQHSYGSSMQGILGSSNLETDSPGILLLDEIQRFRSKNNDGDDIHDYKFQDLWMLLSDGSFGGVSDNKNSLMEMLLAARYSDDYMSACHDVGIDTSNSSREEEESRKKVQESRKFKISIWTAKQMKQQLRLKEPLEEIMTWDSTRKIKLVKEKMDDQSIYDAEVYKKLLIFISGNLDEAYRMADQTGNTDVDADIFHAFSKNINLLKIKNALNSRFKPEQIARFGNSHVVYPSLSRKSYQSIIRRRMDQVSKTVKENSGISITVDQSVYDAVYRNGVFPVQGTRPVFSTITSFFEAVTPTFIFECLSSGNTEAHLYYKDKHLCSQIGEKLIKVKNEGDIDKVKEQQRDKDLITKVALHEAGHAVSYAVLFGVCPTQCTANSGDENSHGFVGLHNMSLCPSVMKNRAIVLLSGRMAEEHIFGKEHISSGASGDIAVATSTAASFFRKYAMGETISTISFAGSQHGMSSNNDYQSQNKEIEYWLRDRKDEASMLIEKHSDLLKSITDYLIKHEEFDLIKSPKPFIDICESHGVAVKWFDPKKTLYVNYSEIYNKRKAEDLAGGKKKVNGYE